MDAGSSVQFDFGGALALCRDLWALADDLEAYARTRDGALQTALTDWRGPEAVKMVDEVRPAELQNLAQGVDQLRNGALGWAASWADAQRQYNNQAYSKAIKDEQDSRSFGEGLVDGFLGKDDSARHVPAPADSAIPQAPAFLPGSGFVSYIQYDHSDWGISYHTADSPHGRTSGYVTTRGAR